MLSRKAPMKRTGFAKAAFKAPSKRQGMKTKQRAVTPEEKALWDKLAGLGCIACAKDGHYNPHVSIHHIDGRTKPGAHKLVLPLCAGHHQDGTGAPGLIAVHPWKKRFETKYGTQRELLALCMKILMEGDN